MKIKITGVGSIVGYTVLKDDELDWLFDNVGSYPTDNELIEFCSDERIWDEFKFKYKIVGPSSDAKLFIDDKPFSKGISANEIKLPKLTNISGDDGILTVIRDYKGTWFKGNIDIQSFDSNKLTYEVTVVNGVEIITKVLYNGKEIVNEITEPIVNNYNTFASLVF